MSSRTITKYGQDEVVEDEDSNNKTIDGQIDADKKTWRRWRFGHSVFHVNSNNEKRQQPQGYFIRHTMCRERMTDSTTTDGALVNG